MNRMSNRDDWDGLVQERVRALDGHSKTGGGGRTQLEPRSGRGRPRIPLDKLSTAARRMRRVNAEKKLAALVCRTCREKSCANHCLQCKLAFPAHQHPDEHRPCQLCNRQIARECLNASKHMWVSAKFRLLCEDCHVLEEDLK